MALIGISGKISSGKDTVGKIIRILTSSPHFTNEAVLDFLEKDSYKSNWQIKKFATIPTEIYKKITNIDFHSLSRTEKELERPNFIDFINNKVKQVFGKDVWVNALMSEYKTKSTLVSEVNYLGDSRCGICKKPTKDISYFLCDEHIEKSKNNFPNWIITDMRFLNEMEAVKKKDGITIRVNRNLEESKNQHESETELDSAEFDYVIDNNGSIEDLIDKIREILSQINI